MENIRRHFFSFLKYFFLIALVVGTFFPLLYTFFASFKTDMEMMAEPGKFFPSVFTLENYKKIFDPKNRFNFVRMTWNSIYSTAIAIVVNLIQSTMIAYVYTRGEFKGKKIIFTLLISTMFITTGGLTVYPVFGIYKAIHMPIGLNALIFRGLFSIPVSHFMLVSGYIKGIPIEMDEAAEIDGCGFFGRYVRIILPNLRAIVATLVILVFNSNWNSYIYPAMYTVGNPEQQTLMVGLMALKNQSDSVASWGVVLAGTMFALIPTLVVFLFFNRYITESVVGSSLKG